MDELDNAQQQLGRALGKAQVGEDKELAALVRDGGERFVRLVQGSLRLTKTHPLDNHAYDQPVTELENTVRKLIDLLGAIQIVAVEDQVYLNDIRIRLDESADGAPTLGADLRRHGVGGITFHSAVDQAGWRLLIGALAVTPDATRPRAALQEKLKTAGLLAVEVTGVFRFHVAGEETVTHRHRNPAAIASQAVGALESSCENLSMNRLPNPLPIRRLVAEMLDTSEADFVGEVPGSAYSAHTWRVTQLVLLIGRGAGMSEAELQDLGVAAMFHDVGYAAREGASATEAGYPPPYERHTTAGARLLLKQRGFHEAKIRRALTALEHHMDHNDPAGRPSIFARIVRIAEDFDNLVRPSAGSYSPALALRLLQAGSGTRYDPLLLQVFINAVGAFPPGTRLELTDGRMAISVSFARSIEQFSAPLVKIQNPDGTSGETVDLSETGAIKRVLL